MLKIEFTSGFGEELWSNIPKVVRGAWMASGLPVVEFLQGWAGSILWHPKDRTYAIMDSTSAALLWTAAMGSGMWKGAALVKDVPVKLTTSELGGRAVVAFLSGVGTNMLYPAKPSVPTTADLLGWDG